LSQSGLSKYPEKGLVHTMRKNSNWLPSYGGRDILGGQAGLGRSMYFSATPNNGVFLVVAALVDGGRGRSFCGFAKSQERPVLVHRLHAGLASSHFTWRILEVSATPITLERRKMGQRRLWCSNLQVRQPIFDLETPFRSFFGFSRPAEAI
jgi:hypothetical protein